MEDKTRYVLYVVILGLALGGLGSIFSGVLAVNSANRVPLATFFLVCLCLFLVLFNYEPLKTTREIEQALIKRVTDSWVADLINFERDGSLFPIGLSFSASAVLYPVRLQPLSENRESKQTAIIEAFESTMSSLLILGEPGSGKTVSLLQLTRVLVERAEKDPAAPLPIVLSLSTWKRGPLELWLVKELRIRYDVEENIARSWILGKRLLFLFDDLNLAESQKDCVAELNTFLKKIGSQGIVVATQETSYKDRLNLSGAIRLKKLSQSYVNGILAKINVEDSAPAQVAEIARMPLMLRIISAAPDVVLEKLKEASDLSDFEREIIGTYVDHRLESAGKMKPPYASRKLKKWLYWLAARSKAVSQPVFAIEELQPNWLEPPKQRRLYVLSSRLLGAIAIMLLGVGIMAFSEKMGRLVGSDSYTFGFIEVRDGLLLWIIITGIFGGFTIGLLDYVRLMPWSPNSIGSRLSNVLRASLLWSNLLVCFTIFLGLALTFRFDLQTSLRAAAAFAVAFALTYWNRDRERSISNDISTAHKLVWTGAHIPKGLHWGLVGGYLCGLVYLTFKLAEYSVPWTSKEYFIFWFSIVAFLLGVAFWPPQTNDPHGQELGGIVTSRFERGVSLATYVGILSAFVVWGVAGLTIGPRVLWLSCLLGSMIGLIVKGLNKVSVLELRTVHQGLKTSLRTTTILWLSVGVPAVILIWGYSARVAEGTFKEAFFFGMMLGLLFGFSYGGLDLIYRFVLRCILWTRGEVPPVVYSTALDDAANLGLLRKIGHAYVFYHDLVRDHFVESSSIEERSTPSALGSAQNAS